MHSSGGPMTPWAMTGRPLSRMLSTILLRKSSSLSCPTCDLQTIPHS